MCVRERDRLRESEKEGKKAREKGRKGVCIRPERVGINTYSGKAETGRRKCLAEECEYATIRLRKRKNASGQSFKGYPGNCVEVLRSTPVIGELTKDALYSRPHCRNPCHATHEQHLKGNGKARLLEMC